MELISCKDWRNKDEVWDILKVGGLSYFMEWVHDRDYVITKFFLKHWKKGSLTILEDQTIKIDDALMSEITGILSEGSKFYKYRKLMKGVIKHFPKTDKERKKLVKSSNTYFSPKKSIIHGEKFCFLL